MLHCDLIGEPEVGKTPLRQTYPETIEANLPGSPELKPIIKSAVSINFFDKNVPNIATFVQLLTAMSMLFFDVFFRAYLVCGYLDYRIISKHVLCVICAV